MSFQWQTNHKYMFPPTCGTIYPSDCSGSNYIDFSFVCLSLSKSEHLPSKQTSCIDSNSEKWKNMYFWFRDPKLALTLLLQSTLTQLGTVFCCHRGINEREGRIKTQNTFYLLDLGFPLEPKVKWGEVLWLLCYGPLLLGDGVEAHRSSFTPSPWTKILHVLESQEGPKQGQQLQQLCLPRPSGTAWPTRL